MTITLTSLIFKIKINNSIEHIDVSDVAIVNEKRPRISLNANEIGMLDMQQEKKATIDSDIVIYRIILIRVYSIAAIYLHRTS